MNDDLPPVGTELTIEQLVDLTVPARDYDEAKRAANRWFFEMTHRVLSRNGLWGWIATRTVWEKTEKGFRRTK